MSRSRPSRLLLAATCCGVLAAALHAANLLYRAHAHGCTSPLLLCPTETGPWATGDYASYRSVADEIGREGILGASYFRRTPGYPLLLLATRALTGEVSPLRWLGPLLAGASAAALVWLAARLGSSPRAGWLAGLGFCLWPYAYRLSQALRPDGIHAFLALLALAATWRWRESRRAPWAAAAAALWAATQSLRPTFFAVALILPALLARRGARGSAAGSAYAAGSALLLAATLAVPAFVVGSNALRHGAAVPTQVAANNLACYAVPRLHAETGRGGFAELRARCLRRFEGLPRGERPAAQLRFAWAAFREQPGASLRSFAGELGRQLLAPGAPSRHRELYPGWTAVGPRTLVLFWLAAAAGVALSLRRAPGLACFALLFAALVMGPATSSHWVGPRLRFPVDLVALPFAALALDRALARLRGARAQRSAAAAPSE